MPWSCVPWPHHRFAMLKENKDTNEALHLLSRYLGVHVSFPLLKGLEFRIFLGFSFPELPHEPMLGVASSCCGVRSFHHCV